MDHRHDRDYLEKLVIESGWLTAGGSNRRESDAMEEFEEFLAGSYGLDELLNRRIDRLEAIVRRHRAEEDSEPCNPDGGERLDADGA
jgi:hypothetical protein